jgi:hypothetical protein
LCGSLIWGTLNAISTASDSRLSNIKEGNRTAVAGSANPNLRTVHGGRQMINPSNFDNTNYLIGVFNPVQLGLPFSAS